MTRLRTRDIAAVGPGLEAYDAELLDRTGMTLRQIACRASGIDEAEALGAVAAARVGVVPVTSGRGILGGFTETVRDILCHLGFRAFVPPEPDVAGVALAVEAGADALFLADDRRFVAIDLRRSRFADNAEATGRGYVAALEGALGGLDGQPVLVVGAGRVGAAAARALGRRGARVGILDRDPLRARRLAGEFGAAAEADLESACRSYAALVEATPARGVLKARHLRAGMVVAAPGVPLGVTAAGRRVLGAGLIHDPLQIGVATMGVSAVAGSGLVEGAADGSCGPLVRLVTRITDIDGRWIGKIGADSKSA